MHTRGCWPRRWASASALLALSTLHVPAADALDVFQVPFTTDSVVDFTKTAFNYLELSINNTGQIGPDGPWQAAVLMLGNYQRKSLTEVWDGGPLVPMWPTGSIITQLLTTEGGGVYSPSANASEPWIEFGNNGTNDMAYADVGARQRSEGQGILDSLTLMNARFEQPGYANLNASIYAMNNSRIVNRDNRTTWRPEVGNLALGRPADNDSQNITFKGTSIIEQMKTQGLVKTNSFGLHLGSAPLQQKASLILGGYDEARVLGPVAAFAMQLGEPFVFLMDVFLGVETGPSHFNLSSAPSSPVDPTLPGPIWQGDAIDDLNVHAGGKKGSIVLFPNPAVPGLYLPSPTCANAAKYLPVTYDNTTKYYLWDTTSPLYTRLIRSPSYLAFTFSSYLATNTTIKIPFTLLNLTLSPPILPAGTPDKQYFPCHDLDADNGYWELGRAFLQGAFFGINYEQNLTFLAQAPGPGMEQSIIRTFAAGDKTVSVGDGKPKSEEEGWQSWVESWRGEWTQLAVDLKGEPEEKKGLSGGAVAGVVIGVLAGLGAVAAMGWFFWRKRREAKEREEKEPKELSTGGQARHKKRRVSKDGGDVKEVDTENGVAEAADTPVMELESPVPKAGTVSEAPTSPGAYEMEGPQNGRFTEVSGESQAVYEMPAEPMRGDEKGGR